MRHSFTGFGHTYDLWKELRSCQLNVRVKHRSIDFLPSGKMLEMVTIDAAKALKLDYLVGSLETGKRADIITVNYLRPHIMPFAMPVDRCVQTVSGQDVSDVIVDGVFVMRDRVPLTVDMNSVLHAAQREFELALRRGGFEHLLQAPVGWGKVRYSDAD